MRLAITISDGVPIYSDFFRIVISWLETSTQDLFINSKVGKKSFNFCYCNIERYQFIQKKRETRFNKLKAFDIEVTEDKGLFTNFAVFVLKRFV